MSPPPPQPCWRNNGGGSTGNEVVRNKAFKFIISTNFGLQQVDTRYIFFYNGFIREGRGYGFTVTKVFCVFWSWFWVISPIYF